MPKDERGVNLRFGKKRVRENLRSHSKPSSSFSAMISISAAAAICIAPFACALTEMLCPSPPASAPMAV